MRLIPIRVGLGACGPTQVVSSTGQCVDISGGLLTTSGQVDLTGVASIDPSINVNLPSTVIPTVSQYVPTAAALANNPQAYGKALLSNVGQQYAQQYGDQYSAQIAQAANFVNNKSVQDLYSGVRSAANGTPLTKEQIQAGFVAGASVGAALGGATLATAAAVMAPIALLVFGGGALIDAGMHAIFGPDSTPTSCSPQDPTVYGKNPSDPNWRTWRKLGIPGIIWNGTPLASTGAFESWARPIYEAALDRVMNCQFPGGAQALQNLALGLVATWNKANSGAPHRSVYLMPLSVQASNAIEMKTAGNPNGFNPSYIQKYEGFMADPIYQLYSYFLRSQLGPSDSPNGMAYDASQLVGKRYSPQAKIAMSVADPGLLLRNLRTAVFSPVGAAVGAGLVGYSFFAKVSLKTLFGRVFG